MLSLFDGLKIALGAALGGILVLTYAAVFLVPQAREEGREAERTAALARSMDLIRERGANDAEIGRMSDGALCSELGGVWMPDEDRCE